MDAVERVDGISLNGSEMPKRIWLITYRHAGDVCWTSDPNPDDADEIETVEYVRADILSLARSNGWQDVPEELVYQWQSERHEWFKRDITEIVEGFAKWHLDRLKGSEG